MQRPSIALGLTCLMLAGFGGWTGCGPSEEEAAARKQEEHRQKLEELQKQHEDLDAKRAELAALEARLSDTTAEDGDAKEAEGEEGAPREEMETQAQQLRDEVNKASEEFYKAVGDFINDEVPILQGEPLSDIQLAAVRMKSDEDILLAKEYIEKGGDYKHAIAIYQGALLADPDNEALKQALAEAQANRFMTQERLSQVKNGMNEEEVREVLGRPNIYNVKEYEKQKVTAWYYPKDEQGAAAAVWFRPSKGELRVYKVDFNAVKGTGDGGNEDTGG